MKIAICLLGMMFAAPVFAAGHKAEVVKNNPEVKSVIAAFESNRGQVCAKDTPSIRISRSGQVKMTVSCNQYDKNGEPMANVHTITIKGYLYGKQFDMGSVSIVGQE